MSGDTLAHTVQKNKSHKNLRCRNCSFPVDENKETNCYDYECVISFKYSLHFQPIAVWHIGARKLVQLAIVFHYNFE